MGKTLDDDAMRITIANGVIFSSLPANWPLVFMTLRHQRTLS